MPQNCTFLLFVLLQGSIGASLSTRLHQKLCYISNHGYLPIGLTIEQLTSFALCCILISLSISCTCCSSLKANAHGTPSNSALVLITHRLFPLKLAMLVAQEYDVSAALLMRLR